MPPMLGHVNGPLYGAVGVGTATNWPGGGYDPELHIAFAPAGNMPGARSLVRRRRDSRTFATSRESVARNSAKSRTGRLLRGGFATHRRSARRKRAARRPPPLPSPPEGAADAARRLAAVPAGGLNVQGLPMIKPPYGLIAAIDLDKGQLKWQTPHGDTPDNIRNHPMLRGKDIPKTGQPGASGVGLMVTKTMVVMGDPQVTTTAEHPRGAMLRAYDKTTGKEIGTVFMPAPQSGAPMTYMADGRQYIIVAISGGNYSGEYIAFRLPDSEVRRPSQ
jgi:quinoprotein glucose dehydrogenase